MRPAAKINFLDIRSLAFRSASVGFAANTMDQIMAEGCIPEHSTGTWGNVPRIGERLLDFRSRQQMGWVRLPVDQESPIQIAPGGPLAAGERAKDDDARVVRVEAGYRALDVQQRVGCAVRTLLDRGPCSRGPLLQCR